MKINTVCCGKYFNKLSFGKVFDIRKIKNLYCPICGSTMFSKEQGREFTAEISSAKGLDLINVINKYENLNSSLSGNGLPVFNSRHQEILNRIKETAQIYEDAELCEIIDILANEIRDDSGSFSTRMILADYKQPYPETQPILSDKDYADVFILNCYNKGCSSYEIAQNFIKNKYPTIEHLVPLKYHGINEKSNYLCDCSECNGMRGSMPFIVWMDRVPELEKNLKIQISQINEALNNSKFDETYEEYPDELANTIKTLSEGKIDLLV